MALDAVVFFVTTFFLYKEKDGPKVDADVGRAFSKKTIKQIQRHLWVFFWPCCCVEIDAKSRSTNASIAYSVIATELPKGNLERLDSLEGQAVRACSSKQIFLIINALKWLSASVGQFIGKIQKH